jgi:uncharacterized Zn finger protein
VQHDDEYYFKPYVTAAFRKRRAEKAAAKLDKAGAAREPIAISGNAIARTFWARSWCVNLERYSDCYNRLDRGRSYLRGGAVIDLQITRGSVKAAVMGSRLYTVAVKIGTVPTPRWDLLCRRCMGHIDSVVELLQGRFSKAVMEHICGEEAGLFPAPGDISFDCSCPDSALMCKHIAAVLYGIGARLDTRPELLFTLRGVDGNDLIAAAGEGVTTPAAGRGTARRLEAADLSALFGIEIVEPAAASSAPKNRGGSRKPKRAPKK